VEPTLIFAGCKLAYEGIKSAVEAYQEIKRTGGEVAGIANEVGGFLSKFFHGQDQLEQEYKAKKEETKELAKQGKPRNVTMEAIDNVLMVRQIRQYYRDLEQMVRWELGMPDLWTEIVEERDRLLQERKIAKQEEDRKIMQAKLKREYFLYVLRQRVYLVLAIIIGVFTIVGSVWAIKELVEADRIRRWGY